MRALLLILALAAAPASAQPLAKTLFGAARTASSQSPAAIGSYAEGCLAGAVQVPLDGPGWQVVRPSRNRNWAHPESFSFVTRLAEAAREVGWPGILVADISQPRGGPMTDGHASHQIGLDLDIWLRSAPAAPMTREAREAAGSVAMVAPDRRSVTADWTPSHARLLRAAAEDPAVARIFVNAAIKAQLCRTASGPWLAKIRPWWGHDSHFHVRLACPTGAASCADQDPPPEGDGCDASLNWWFSDEALNPPPPATPPVRARDVMTLADLPPACAAVLDAQ